MGRSELIFCLAAEGESAAQTFDVVVSPKARLGIPQAFQSTVVKKNKAIWKSDFGVAFPPRCGFGVWTGLLRQHPTR
jgi:hypothetical protein